MTNELKCDLCGDGGTIYLHARCHGVEPPWVCLTGDVLTLECSVCKRLVSRFRLAQEGTDPAAARLEQALQIARHALSEQHDAIDQLFARLTVADENFSPSRTGQPWRALLEGNEAMKAIEATMLRADNQGEPQ
jgi:hypothetical protein